MVWNQPSSEAGDNQSSSNQQTQTQYRPELSSGTLLADAPNPTSSGGEQSIGTSTNARPVQKDVVDSLFPAPVNENFSLVNQGAGQTVAGNRDAATSEQSTAMAGGGTARPGESAQQGAPGNTGAMQSGDGRPSWAGNNEGGCQNNEGGWQVHGQNGGTSSEGQQAVNALENLLNSIPNNGNMFGGTALDNGCGGGSVMNSGSAESSGNGMNGQWNSQGNNVLQSDINWTSQDLQYLGQDAQTYAQDVLSGSNAAAPQLMLQQDLQNVGTDFSQIGSALTAQGLDPTGQLSQQLQQSYRGLQQSVDTLIADGSTSTGSGCGLFSNPMLAGTGCGAIASNGSAAFNVGCGGAGNVGNSALANSAGCGNIANLGNSACSNAGCGNIANIGNSTLSSGGQYANPTLNAIAGSSPELAQILNDMQNAGMNSQDLSLLENTVLQDLQSGQFNGQSVQNLLQNALNQDQSEFSDPNSVNIADQVSAQDIQNYGNGTIASTSGGCGIANGGCGSAFGNPGGGCGIASGGCGSAFNNPTSGGCGSIFSNPTNGGSAISNPIVSNGGCGAIASIGNANIPQGNGQFFQGEPNGPSVSNLPDATAGPFAGTNAGARTGPLDPATAEPSPMSPPQAGMVMTFNDNFSTGNSDISGDSAASGGTSNWTNHIWWNDTTTDASVQNGVLVIPSDQSGGGCGSISTINSNGQGFTQKYGFFEASIYQPTDTTHWDGFWMMSAAHAQNVPGSAASEIDIMEQNAGWGNSDSSGYYATVHEDSSAGCGQTWQNSNNFVPTPNVNISAGWHTYGVDWTPSGVTYYLDGKPVEEVPASQFPSMGSSPMFLVVGNSGGGCGNMLVSDVRAYQYPQYMNDAQDTAAGAGGGGCGAN